MRQLIFSQAVVRERIPCATTEKRKHNAVTPTPPRSDQTKGSNLVPHPHRPFMGDLTQCAAYVHRK